MNLHDNRHTAEEAVRRITDVGKLQNLAIGLLEMLSFMTAKRDRLLAEKRAMQAKERALKRGLIRFEVMTPENKSIASYRRRAYAERFIQRQIWRGRYREGELSIMTFTLEPQA